MSDYKGGMGGMDMSSMPGMKSLNGKSESTTGGRRRTKHRKSGYALGKKTKSCGKTRRRRHRRTRSRSNRMFFN